jgi:anti-anti-sigma regulatory factor
MPDWMAQFKMRFTLNGKVCTNVLYLRKQVFAIALPTNAWVNESWGGEDIITDANNVMISYGTHFMPLASTACELDAIDWVFNESVPDGPLHEGSSTHSAFVGSNGPATLPNSVSLAIHLGTGLGGRSNMGRFFFVGVGDGLIDSPNWNNIKPGSVSDLTAAGAAFLADVNQDPGIPVVGDKRNRLIVASFVIMKKISDITERQTTLTPVADEPWADELTIPDTIRDKILIKHIHGPLFFGFASQFRDIARQAGGLGRLLILRMDRISYLDQTGVYALQDALTTLNAAGAHVLVVGLSVAHLDLLQKLHVIPDVVPESDVFKDFAELKQALEGRISGMNT